MLRTKKIIQVLLIIGVAVAFGNLETSRSEERLYLERADVYIRRDLYDSSYYSIPPADDVVVSEEMFIPCFHYQDYVRVGAGVFLSEKWIVTSAFLVRKLNVSDMVILTGRRSCNETPLVITVQQIVLHRYFNAYDHDVALLKVSPNHGCKVFTLRLPLTEPESGTTAILSSWARNQKFRTGPSWLTHTGVTVHNRGSCQRYYAFPILTERNMCAMNKTLEIWHFSIGDPLTYQNRLLGLFQGNHHPGFAEAPAIYVNVVASSLWLKMTMSMYDDN